MTIKKGRRWEGGQKPNEDSILNVYSSLFYSNLFYGDEKNREKGGDLVGHQKIMSESLFTEIYLHLRN